MSVERHTTRQHLNANLAAMVTIRSMTYGDLKQVIDVETRAYPHPWTLGIFRDCLRVGYQAWVLTMERSVIGYGVMMQSPGEAHLLNICIDPDYQGRGLGRHFLRFLVDRAKRDGVDMLLLEVRRSNRLAHALYLSEGFHELGVRKAYYPTDDGREDAIILAKTLR